MTADIAWLRGQARRALLAGAGAAALLLLCALLLGVRPALGGWLIGLVFWIGIALGALALLATHALTGGAWLAALRPVLMPAALSLPVFALLVLPLLLGMHALYPWASDPGAAGQPDVAAWYLAPAGFALRTALALAGWSIAAILLVRDGARHSGIGAAALMLHALAISIIPLDWVLSLDPRFRSSAFGMATAVNQVLAALAWCAVLRPEAPGGRGQAGDLAAMLFAAALGAAYLGFAQFLVSWYGNLPEKAAWFVARRAQPWMALEVAALLLASALPCLALLSRAVRRVPRRLAVVGAGVLAGTLLHQAWLIGPAIGPEALLTGTLGVAAIGGIWIFAAFGLAASRIGTEREAWHGAR